MYRLFFCKNQQEIDPLSECTLKALESNANPLYFAAKSTESCHQEIWGPLGYLGRAVFFPHDKTNGWNALLNFRLKFRSVFQAKIVMIIHNVWLMWPSITTSIKDIPSVKASLPFPDPDYVRSIFLAPSPEYISWYCDRQMCSHVNPRKIRKTGKIVLQENKHKVHSTRDTHNICVSRENPCTWQIPRETLWKLYWRTLPPLTLRTDTVPEIDGRKLR